MIYLTRRERFNAAHKLYNEKWTEAENKEIFGKCSNKNWHGHNYHLYVTVKGRPNPDTGFVMNAKDLATIIKKVIISKVDHSNLNLDVDFMEGVIPSTENFAKSIWNELVGHIKGAELHCIRLYETENIFVDYFGEE